MWAAAIQAVALTVGVYALMCGVAFFLVGLLPGPSAAWWKQYAYAAIALVVAFYLIPIGIGH